MKFEGNLVVDDGGGWDVVVTVRCDRMFSLSAKKVHTNGDDVDDVDNGNAVTKEMVLLKGRGEQWQSDQLDISLT